MALHTTLATRYWLKTIIMVIVCLVLGVWGIWDYVVAIPEAELGATRAALLADVVQPAMETEIGSEERSAATVLLDVNIEILDFNANSQWITSVDVFKNALTNSAISDPVYEETLHRELNLYGDITPPSKYDRPMQWLFILCLPFGVYYLRAYLIMKKKAGLYSLEDDGTLTTPEGVWKSNEITDIDMSRWIAKTGNARSTWIAKAVVEDAPPVVLDDYIYNDMHMIIGTLAHRFYPDQWTPLARRVKIEDVESSHEDEEE